MVPLIQQIQPQWATKLFNVCQKPIRCKKTLITTENSEIKDQKMPRFGRELGEGKTGTHRLRQTRNGKIPQGLTGTWVQAKGRKGGI